MPQAEIREAVCVFRNQDQLDAAIKELEVTAFPRHDISVLASDREIKTAFGTSNIQARHLEDSPITPRDISVRPEEKTIIGTDFTGISAYIGGCAAAILAKDGSVPELLSAIAAGSALGFLLGGMTVTQVFLQST